MAISKDTNNSPRSAATAHDRMHADAVHAGLRALEALLNFEGEQASFADLCQRLRQVFGQDHAMVLAEDADALVCIAAAPSGAIGARRPRDPFFIDVLRGAVRSIAGSRGSDAGQSFPADLIPAGASALCLPIGLRGRRALLLLRREAGKAEFGKGGCRGRFRNGTHSFKSGAKHKTVGTIAASTQCGSWSAPSPKSQP